MSRLPEITDLFARLASNLQTLKTTVGDEDQTCDLLISNLNCSLNLNENSRVRVLDTALSLMGFRAPQVFDSGIEYLVRTIVTVLSSTIACKVLRFQKEEVLQIGSTISRRDCAELIEFCADVLGRLDGHGMLSHTLLHAVVRVAVSASCFRYVLELTPILDVKSIEGRSLAVSKLLCHLQKEISLRNEEIPLRLLLWYLDPLILKNDLLQILQEAIRRPFLCLNIVFYERTDWRLILLCLALTPAMFIETRALLHNWFLMTGLATVLELQIELVRLILDVISRPTWWGITMEVGSNLPSSHAYFPQKHHLMRTLAGPLSFENFLHLVHSTSKPVPNAKSYSDSTLKQDATKFAMIGHKSMWAMAMNFPEWFFFASLLLFAGKNNQDIFHSECTLGAAETEQSQDIDLPCFSASAARHIAWILSPISESHQNLLVDSLIRISESWRLKLFSSDNHYKVKAGYKKKLKKPKFHDISEESPLLKEFDCRTIQYWLQEFQDIYIKYWNEIVNSSASFAAKSSCGISLKQSVLFRKIPLGILIGYSTGINEDGCELLLHYVVTGSILQLTETQTAGLNHRKWIAGEQEDFDKCNIKEAVAGACLVFRLTDVVESMSASMFDTEEGGIDSICRLKQRTGKYLFKCIKKLLQLNIDEDNVLMMLRDLYSRLVRWRHQGRDVFQGSEDLNDAIEALSNKLSSC
ncbi:uncharacterized protein LOC132275917 [Cornus florida]|uniref:uncharacterized protein LOC132275917 n=1 Tax=Cornus florida TaxID=4283 RepID=UPI00289F9A0C|nr:uncharacterized protein LOC132275917 [Cornus florida]